MIGKNLSKFVPVKDGYMIRPRVSSILIAVCVLFAGVAISSCSDSKSYAELLTDENHSVNRFLADNKVIDHIPADSVFEIGPDAPYYLLDEENSIYMQVLDAGESTRPREGQVVYFRYMRYSLSYYYGDFEGASWNGNANNMIENPAYFKFDDYNDYSSQTWGTGLQQPLKFLGFNSEVNIVIKSTYGPTSEQQYVTPYLYRIRYFKSQI